MFSLFVLYVFQVFCLLFFFSLDFNWTIALHCILICGPQEELLLCIVTNEDPNK